MNNEITPLVEDEPRTGDSYVEENYPPSYVVELQQAEAAQAMEEGELLYA